MFNYYLRIQGALKRLKYVLFSAEVNSVNCKGVGINVQNGIMPMN